MTDFELTHGEKRGWRVSFTLAGAPASAAGGTVAAAMRIGGVSYDLPAVLAAGDQAADVTIDTTLAPESTARRVGSVQLRLALAGAVYIAREELAILPDAFD